MLVFIIPDNVRNIYHIFKRKQRTTTKKIKQRTKIMEWKILYTAKTFIRKKRQTKLAGKEEEENQNIFL